MKNIQIFISISFLFLMNSVQSQNNFFPTILSEIKIDSLMHHVEEISGYKGVWVDGELDTIKSRNKFQPGNELCFRFIAQELRSYGLEVDSGLFGTRGKNIWAVQPGVVYPDQYYILCAHYDDMPTGSIAPAADDDGSGVGTVLEAARILSRYQFEYTIVYAFWDEEEYSLSGSNNYATVANTNGDQLLGVLNMDAIAWDSDNDSVARIHVRPIANSENLGDTVFMMNTRYNLGLDLQLNNPGATYSDHASFWNKGFSALLIIQDWDNDPNPHYHLVSDSITYFNVPYFEKLAKLSILSIATLAIPVGYLGNETVSEKINAYIYPNPVNEKLNIHINDFTDQLVAKMYDMNGRLIDQFSIINSNTTIETNHLTKGIYLLKIENNSINYQIKFLKN